MAKYKIKNTNILHNGELKKIGDIIELNKDEAEKLADVLIPVKETPTKTETKTETKTPAKTTKNKTQDDKTPETETKEDGGNK